MIWWRHCTRLERKFYCRIPWGSHHVVVSHGLSESELLHFRVILSCFMPRLELGIVLLIWEVLIWTVGKSLSVRRSISFTLDRSDLSTWIAKRAALAASYCKLENHLVFYFNLLLIVYLLYSIKVTVSLRSLVCFYLVICFIITVCRPL